MSIISNHPNSFLRSPKLPCDILQLRSEVNAALKNLAKTINVFEKNAGNNNNKQYLNDISTGVQKTSFCINSSSETTVINPMHKK